MGFKDRQGLYEMTFKKCKYDGCEVQVEMRSTDVGWRPFEESGNKHNCQYSDYAKKQKAAGFHIQDRPQDDHYWKSHRDS